MEISSREKKFDDIFSRLDTIHQRDVQTDGWTDGQTPGDSKDRAYAQRRAVKTNCTLAYYISAVCQLLQPEHCNGKWLE